MTIRPKFYRLVEEPEVDLSGSVVTRALLTCRCCGKTICTVGGPQVSAICQSCGDEILSGKYEQNLRMEVGNAYLLVMQAYAEGVAYADLKIANGKGGDAIKRAWEQSDSKRALEDAVADNKCAIVPIEPSRGLLISMALRHNHGLAMPAHLKVEGVGEIVGGHVDEEDRQRKIEAAITKMRQVYEEVVGAGFYAPETEDKYLKLVGVPADDPQA